MILKNAFDDLKKRFHDAGIDTPALDARILVCHAVNMTHEEFILNSDREVSQEHQAQINLYAEQRLLRKPVAKIIQQKEFYGRLFLTNQHTLDPRPDSEILIDAVKKYAPKGPLVDILDMGTGTGCLLLTLLAEMLDTPRAIGTAVEHSTRALAVAQENAATLNVADRVVFVKSDWFTQVTGRFDIIISNPPYIPQADIQTLQAEVRLFDPMLALTGGIDGLDPYRILVDQAPDFLKPGGMIIFEVGQGQADDVSIMLKNKGFTGIDTVNDLNGIARVVLAFAA